MARVFLSYRRADGPYAVGWIAERLARLDEVTEVRTAFYDTELRAGDPYPTALDEAVAASDVVIAIIGPNWRGVRGDGSARILDDDDWVAREVGSALAHGTIVLPVLIDGAEPLAATQLRAEHAPLAELHALRFDGLDDLDEVERHLRSHLDDIDRRHAVERGLSEPLSNPPLRPRGLVVLAALVAAVVAAALGWATFEWFGSGSDAEPDDVDAWAAAAAMLWAAGAAGAVIGIDVVGRRFRSGTRIRTVPVLLFLAGGIAILGWTGLQPAAPADVRVEVGQWVGSAVAVALAAPWGVGLTGVAWTTITLDDRDLGGRAQVIGRLGQSSLVSAGAIAGLATFGVATTAYAGAVLDRSGFGEQLRIVGQGALYTGLLVAVLTWSRTRLERLSVELGADLAELPPTYRRHAEPLLVTEPFDRRARWIVPMLAVPTAAGIIAALTITG